MRSTSVSRSINSIRKTMLMFALIFSYLAIGQGTLTISRVFAQSASPRIQPSKQTLNKPTVKMPQTPVNKQFDEADLVDIEKYEFSLNKPVSLVISIPTRKPNDQYWDGLPQWAMGGLTQFGQAGGFFPYDSPPDIHLFAVTAAGEVTQLGFAQDRFEAEFTTDRLPEIFGLVAIDRDGIGFKGRFHDFIGAAIFSKYKRDVDEPVRQAITERIYDQLNRVGVQHIAYPLEFNAAGQVPSRFRVISITDCVAKPCRLSRTDGVVIQFSNDID